MGDDGTAIGVDVGGTNLRVARVSRSGEILERRAEPITRDAALVVDRIATLCAALDDGGVVGIGIGVPGRVDARRRTVLSGGYLDLAAARLADTVEQRLRRPVAIDNDASMALTAEMAMGAAMGRDTVVLLTIGTGIGGALALDGRVGRGRATAGQLGHLTVASGGLSCACGRRGCLETTSSGTALQRLLAEAGLPPGTPLRDLLDRAEGADAVAAGVVDRWAAPLRDGIDSLVATLDPDLVVLGGGLGSEACRALARWPARSPWYQCPVAPARLGDDAGVIGAALGMWRTVAAGEAG